MGWSPRFSQLNEISSNGTAKKISQDYCGFLLKEGDFQQIQNQLKLPRCFPGHHSPPPTPQTTYLEILIQQQLLNDQNGVIFKFYTINVNFQSPGSSFRDPSR